MTTKSTSVGIDPFVPAQVATPRRLRLIDMLRMWQSRFRGRRELYRLSELELRDIGYPAAIEEEKAKPFWRA
jgi:uncharacterized protein YjiS (DUF1127 family)